MVLALTDSIAMSTTTAITGLDDGRDHSNRQGMFLAVIITFTSISTIMVFLRVYTRAVIVRSFGKDDWAIIASMVLMVTFCIISCLYVHYGFLGYHVWDFVLSPKRNLVYRKLQITNQLLYNPVLTLCKTSILLFYQRISPSAPFQRCIWGTMAVVIALAISVFFADLMQCTPIPFFWDKTILGGTCIDGVAFYFGTAGISTFTDMWILVMPMPMVWGLHLPLRQRVIIMVLFALGGVVCVMSVLRLVTFQKLYFVTKDPSYSDASLWSPLECNMAIICASIPSYRPLISHYFPNLLSGGASRSGGSGSEGVTGNSSSALNPRRQNANAFSLAEMGSSGRSHGLQKLGDNDSEEEIIHHTGEIKAYGADERKSNF